MKAQEKVPLIAISLATYKRPELLEKLLLSLCELTPIENVRIELRVIDNDKNGSGKNVLNKVSGLAHFFDAVRYQIEEEQNIALARNAGLDMGPADAIVFIDDDERMGCYWLLNLWNAFQFSGADAIFGPVYGQIRKGSSAWLSNGGFFV